VEDNGFLSFLEYLMRVSGNISISHGDISITLNTEDDALETTKVIFDRFTLMPTNTANTKAGIELIYNV